MPDEEGRVADIGNDGLEPGTGQSPLIIIIPLQLAGLYCPLWLCLGSDIGQLTTTRAVCKLSQRSPVPYVLVQICRRSQNYYCINSLSKNR